MNLIYYGTFKDINENTIRVEFYDDSTTSSPKEVILSSNPVRVYYEQDNIVSSFKKSGASITLLVPNILSNLYSSEYNGVKVKIYKNGEMFWFGYVTPNIYTQNYNDEYDELTIECNDTITLLSDKKVDYEDIANAFSFREIIYKILDEIDPDKEINNVIVHDLLGNDIISKYGVIVRNFYDEIEEPATLEEIMDGILKYLNLSMLQWGNSYYLMSFPDLAKYNVAYNHNRTSNNKTTTTIPNAIKNVSNIGVHNTNGTVSMGETYNQFNIIANTVSTREAMPELFDVEDLENQNENPEMYYLQYKDVEENDEKKKNTIVYSFWKSKENWNWLIPITIDETVVNEVTDKNYNDIMFGTYWNKTTRFEYETLTAPATVNFDNTLTHVSYDPYTHIVGLKKKLNLMYQGGFFVVNFKYQLSNVKLPVDILEDEDVKEDTFNADDSLKFMGRIGIKDKYYYQNHKNINGEWVSYEEFNKKKACGYYFKPVEPYKTEVTHPYWYKIWRGEYYEYVSYKTYGESTETNKLSGACESNICYFFWDENNYAVSIPDEFGEECLMLDRCWLYSKYKSDDKIFYTDRELTNGVWWWMRFDDPVEGQLIKLPDNFALLGELVFDIYAPDCMGTRIDYAASKAVSTIHITDLYLKYITMTGKLYEENKNDDKDIKYNNTINENYAKEGEDITMIVNTWNDEQPSYSYVIDLNSDAVVKELKNNANNEVAIAEEHLLNKYVNHFKTPKIAYENILKNKDLTPFSILKENNLDKTMIMQSITYNMVEDAAEISIKEY